MVYVNMYSNAIHVVHFWRLQHKKHYQSCFQNIIFLFKVKKIHISFILKIICKSNKNFTALHNMSECVTLLLSVHTTWFESIWEWVNHYRIFMFEWTIPLISPVIRRDKSLVRVQECPVKPSNISFNVLKKIHPRHILVLHCILFSSFSPFQHSPGSLHWFHGWTHKIQMPANRCVLKTWQGTVN